MKKILRLIVLFVFAGVGGLILQAVIQNNLSPEDSSALYGGVVERGYPSAGYMLFYNQNGLSLCGYAALNRTTAITAAHCVDGEGSIYVGKGNYSSNPFNNLKVDRAIPKAGWIQEQRRTEDFSLLKFSPVNNYFQDFAEIASPIDGCFFRVVAYGRTENPAERANPPRKSAVLCASDIRDTIFTVKGRDSGICFGDSGSPVYFNGTNKVVGVVVSILNKEDSSDPCGFNNTALVVRADAQRKLIADSIEEEGGNSATVTVVDGTTIQVADRTLLERIGLSRLENLDDREKNMYVLNSLIIAIVTLIITILATLFLPRRNQQPTATAKVVVATKDDLTY